MSTENIIAHMNRDHRVSLYDFLAYYGGITLDLDDSTQSVELVDVKLDKLVLNYNKNGQLKSTSISLDPPMKSLGDARSRFISMSIQAADGLKVSPYRITKYIKSKGGMRALYVGLAIMVSVCAKVTFNPTFAQRFVSALGLSSVWIRNIKFFFAAVLTIHHTEFFVSVIKLMNYHRMPLRLKVMYYFSTAFVGLPAWVPLSQESKRLEAQRKEFERKVADGTLSH